HIQVVKEYLTANGMFFTADNEDPFYTDVVELDLSTIEPNMSGPKRPQDLIPLSEMKSEFNKAVVAPQGNQGFGLSKKRIQEVCYCNDG
ncbi:hypothetical protein JQK62_24540, partial [Leptospira santarosai]|nr:hypothetical protein [Leptospira santarosai]